MQKIKVLYGGCGISYKDANGIERHTLKTPESGAFECDDAQAAHLVSLGQAEYVSAPKAQQEEQADGTQEDEKVTGHLDAAQLEEMDYNDLKKLAAEMGVKPNGNKKADYIEALVAVEVELGDEIEVDDDEDADNELPELSAADPE